MQKVQLQKSKAISFLLHYSSLKRYVISTHRFSVFLIVAAWTLVLQREVMSLVLDNNVY